MSDWENITYPKFFIHLSKELSLLRTKLSKDVYKEGTDTFRGKQESSISQLGILAELIAQNFITDLEIKYQSAPLIDLSPVVDCDIKMDVYATPYLIDVKGVKKEETNLRVNFNSHNNKNKEITHYLFIHIISTTEARYKFYNFNDVSNWKVVKSTYSDCYTKVI